LIVGAGSVGELIVKRISEDPRYGLRPVGFLDADPMPIAASGVGHPAVPVLGAESDLRAAVALTGAQRVILAFSAQPDHELVDQIRECQQLGVGVSLVPRLFESINERATLDHVGGLPLLSLRPTDPSGWEFAVKHAIDRGVAVLALIGAAPLMAAIALAIRLTSPGPVLFRQRRVGRDGQVFDLLKFRTMYEATGPVDFELRAGSAPGGVEGEDRRTPFGKWLRDASLDELPQLINVARGEMSLVGPRPERPEFVERFTGEVLRYQDRHRVKSGITGWAQVNGLRGQTSIGDRVEWDNYYIRNWSLRLDLRIVALTLTEILRWRDSATSRPGRTEAAYSSPRPRGSADS
jgi:exopolysaccharide biosynthesis polyprenyl glycosylphosphotransferase